MSQTANQLKKILEELDNEKLSQLSDEKVLELRKQLNPYGRIIEGSDKYLTFSYTDLSEKYQKRLITTSMIGFLNRMNAEWEVPDGIPVVHPYDYVKDKSLLADPSTFTDAACRTDSENNIKLMEKRIIVQEFLESLFQFDPDEHVRSVYRPVPKDLERKSIKTPAASRAVKHLMKTDSKFKEKMEKLKALEDLKEKTKEVEQKLGEFNLGKQEIQPLNENENDRNGVKRFTTEMIPPVDTFGRFDRYCEVNYDKLREVTNDLYCEKPDLDRAICPHSWHDSRDDADTYINKHKDEMITEVTVAHSGKWNFFAPFEKVRSSARYFNSQTIVLEEMLKQIEQDSKLGQDLMKKRVAKKKKKNIEESGPDDPGFAKWKAQNTTLKDMGAWTQKNENSMAPDDCPEDSVAVDVFSFSKGGTSVKKSTFFTEAEAPGKNASM
jgi:hypothetical protein